MSWTTGLRLRLQQLLRPAAADARAREEFAFHLDMETARLERLGLSPADARRRARLAFGGVERHREALRDGRVVPLLDELGRDVRRAARSLARAPAFTAAAVLTLALGVAANTAVFALVSARLLRPLPFAEPARLVTVYQERAPADGDARPTRWSHGEFRALRASATTLAPVAAYFADDVNLSSGGAAPMRVRAEMISAGYLRTLGVAPVVGRDLAPAEDSVPGAHPVVLLGHALWARGFGADPAIVGRAVALNGVTLTVIGVLPPGFRGLTDAADVWLPHAMAPAVYYAEHLTTSQRFLSVVGRLRAGATLAQARAELAGPVAHVVAAARPPAGDDGPSAAVPAVAPLESTRRDPDAARAQLVLAGAVAFVLLLAAANLGGLLLARAIGRSRELAIQAALGAGRRRAAQAVLVEGGLVAAAGGALGALLAGGSLRLLAAVAPDVGGGAAPSSAAQVAVFAAPALDWRVLLFAALAAVVTGLGAALPAALRAARGAPPRTLAIGGRGSTVVVGSLRRPTLLSGLAVVQLAVALVLLAGAGSLLRGFGALRAATPGVAPAGVLAFRISPPERTYGGAGAAPLLERLLARMEAVPGVRTASVGRCLPLAGDACSTTPLYRPGQPADDAPVVGRHYVGPDHFRTLGIPVLRGRALTADDRAGRPRVAVVNETAARRLWPGRDPIGRRVWFGSGGGFASPDSLTEIVGVVADVPYAGPGRPVQPDVYTSYLQFTWPETMVIVRADGDPLALVPGLRAALAESAPDVPPYDLRTMEAHLADALADERLATAALSAFAALGLLLAVLGVYGVMSYSVAQRRRELGIRLALGATPAGVRALVVRQGLALAGVGLAAGLAISLALARALDAVMPDAGAPDPVVLGAVALLLLAAAVLTALLPARAAGRVDPVRTIGAD